jgi:hypothetical protein
LLFWRNPRVYPFKSTWGDRWSIICCLRFVVCGLQGRERVPKGLVSKELRGNISNLSEGDEGEGGKKRREKDDREV